MSNTQRKAEIRNLNPRETLGKYRVRIKERYTNVTFDTYAKEVGDKLILCSINWLTDTREKEFGEVLHGNYAEADERLYQKALEIAKEKGCEIEDKTRYGPNPGLEDSFPDSSNPTIVMTPEELDVIRRKSVRINLDNPNAPETLT